MLTLNHFCCSLISIRRLQTFLRESCDFAPTLPVCVCVLVCMSVVCFCNYLCCSFVQRPRQLNKAEGASSGVGAIKGAAMSSSSSSFSDVGRGRREQEHIIYMPGQLHWQTKGKVMAECSDHKIHGPLNIAGKYYVSSAKRKLKIFAYFWGLPTGSNKDSLISCKLYFQLTLLTTIKSYHYSQCMWMKHGAATMTHPPTDPRLLQGWDVKFNT